MYSTRTNAWRFSGPSKYALAISLLRYYGRTYVHVALGQSAKGEEEANGDRAAHLNRTIQLFSFSSLGSSALDLTATLQNTSHLVQLSDHWRGAIWSLSSTH